MLKLPPKMPIHVEKYAHFADMKKLQKYVNYAAITYLHKTDTPSQFLVP